MGYKFVGEIRGREWRLDMEKGESRMDKEYRKR